MKREKQNNDKGIQMFLLLQILLLLTGILGGCAKTKTHNSPQKKYKKQKEVTIEWWAFPDFAQENGAASAGVYERKLIRAFEKQYPQIKVKLRMLDFSSGPDKISQALRNRNTCDVLLDAPGRIMEYARKGYLCDLTGMFSKEFRKDVDNKAILDACCVQNRAYMYPLSSAPFYMAFNQKMLQQAGVENLVKEGWTTDAFITVLQALQDKKYVPGTLFYKSAAGDQATRALVANLYDTSVLNTSKTQYNLAKSGGIKALDCVRNLVAEGYLRNGWDKDADQALQEFATGNCSYTLLWGPNQQKSYTALLRMNHVKTVEVPYPSEDGKSELECLVNGFCIFDNKDDEKREAARKFILFACDNKVWGPESVRQTGCIPVRKSFGQLYSQKRMETIAGWTKYYGVYYNNIEGFPEMRTYWCQLWNDLLQQQQSSRMVAKWFVTKSGEAMQKDKQGGSVHE